MATRSTFNWQTANFDISLDMWNGENGLSGRDPVQHRSVRERHHRSTGGSPRTLLSRGTRPERSG